MRRTIQGLACFLLLLLSTTPDPAQLTSQETDDLRLVYLNPTSSFIAPYTEQCFENSMRFQMELFDYVPWEPVTVLLLDLADFGNAGANASPRNQVSIQIAPSSLAYETMTSNERMNSTLNHELVHVAALDKASAFDRFFRHLFLGKVRETSEHPETILYSYLTVPRMSAPRWYHEGLAVFIETWMSGGIGRAQGSYDEMVFRSMVRDGTRFYDPVGLVSEGARVDFQVGANLYLYGTRFMSYLAWNYSPESLISWARHDDGSKGYYASQFKRVFGVPLIDAWRDWIDWEHSFQQQNIDAIEMYPTTPYRDITTTALGSVSRAWLDRDAGKLYTAFNYPGIVSHVGAVSMQDGSLEKVKEVKDPMLYSVTSLAWDPDGRTLFYTTDNNAYRDLVALSPDTGKAKLLLKDARIGDMVYSRTDKSLWGIRHFNGISTLVNIPFPYEDWRQVHSWPYGDFAYDLDISPDGTLLSFSYSEISGNQSLRVVGVEALERKDATPIARHDFGITVPSNFVFSPDGRYLYGSTYYTGVSNIFRWDYASDTMDAVTNTTTGMFRPVPLGDDELIVFRYSGEGFIPAVIEAKPLEDVSAITLLGERIASTYPIIRQWKAGSPADISLDSLVRREREYNSFSTMRLESLYPIVEGYKDFSAYGFNASFSDPIRLNNANIEASWSPAGSVPDNERLHLQAKYERYNLHVTYKYNAADFYDLFGPTKRSRKGYSLGVDYSKSLIYDAPRELKLDLGAAYFNNLDRLPRYQNVAATFDSTIQTSAGLRYEYLRSSLGAVDHEKGIDTGIWLAADHVAGDTIPSAVAGLDLGFPLPLHHSSIWLRSWTGRAFGDPDDPFANLYFGGFGNNRVDRGEIKRYREFYAFPGFELNEIGGQSFVKSMVEWNLPPIRFGKAGSPGLHLSWARASVFAGGMKVNMEENDTERTVGDYGAQIDFRFTALSRLKMTFSLGYAVGFEKEGMRRKEIMYSLKIL